jgi:hypothetical protein
MTQKTPFIVLAWLLMILFLLSACAGRELEVESIPKSGHPQVLIDNLENEIALARNARINVLSPTWFAKAESSLRESKKLLDEGAQLVKIFDDVATGRAQLRRAKEIAAVSSATLADAIKGRELARDAGAAALGKDYTEVEDEFLKLTRAIEQNNLGYAQRNQAEVTEKFRQLEVRAIKVRTIGEVRNLLRIAQKQKSDKTAPESYAAAINKLTEADAFITENPYNKEQMGKLANEALFLSRRHLQIASETKKIQEMTPEQTALRMEATLQKTARYLSAPDMRDQPFDQQIENI